MNKSFFTLPLAMLILSGCSADVSTEEDEKVNESVTEQNEAVDTASTTTNDIEENADFENSNDDNADGDQQTMEESDVQTGDVAVDAVDIVDSVEEADFSKETVKNVEEVIEAADIKDNGFYMFYNTLTPNNTNEEKVKLNFEQVDETTIELPTYNENEPFFKDNVTTVKLTDLEENFIQFYDEPISGGHLVNLDVNRIYEKYSGISMSLRYNGIEYPIMVGSDKEAKGFTVIDVASSTEQLMQAELLIMNY